MIYLDYAASTPMSDRAILTYTKAAKEYFGNTQSSHDSGTNASQLLELARTTISTHLNGDPSGVYFTSGGTEANILTLTSLIKRYPRGHLITTQGEHSSVLHTFAKLEEEGYRVSYLTYNHEGKIEVEQLLEVISEDTILVSIASGNSETGTTQPIEEIGRELYRRNILFHTDAVQTFGKMPIDVQKLNISALSISSHKLHGPKGVGACYINPSVPWNPLIPGTVHEKGFRPGTVNVPGICSFTAAVEETFERMEPEQKRLQNLRSYLLNRIVHPNIVIEGQEQPGLANIIGLRIKGLEGQYAMLEFNRKGIAVSTGSACSVGQQKPSKTLLSMGRNEDEARELIRISFGRETTEEDLKKTADVFQEILTRCSATKI
ncbi:IscS subfamily cysteine desulfurase [Pseudalkalibacillus hwajinpoensis]|uniref:Aminotransferase class V-fold PLP-dependent enzyme n=1 Tax=Guptibacillus hwajinpoensis TaxID=208199 RepID=A0A4U1MID5_9BACL|nr:IscS subfamily cysteine desulfurase [Pseudalkalibacillus hwajinpoensis]TKD70274.1 aminotransferase class V-fold PLP-dependent enzyme [Pseudalkalibacillus hwajinpoensis]